MAHLLRDKVEKRRSILEWQQALRLLEPHACARAASEPTPSAGRAQSTSAAGRSFWAPRSVWLAEA
eukprot:3077741-Prymnesium_polylepis.1